MKSAAIFDFLIVFKMFFAFQLPENMYFSPSEVILHWDVTASERKDVMKQKSRQHTLGEVKRSQCDI